jgi:hypothetical protein
VSAQDPFSEGELRRVTAAARAGTLDPDEVSGLCEEIRRLRKFSGEVSLQLERESQDRQDKAWERDYWEDLYRFRAAGGAA